jgi:hypothetical protein
MLGLEQPRVGRFDHPVKSKPPHEQKLQVSASDFPGNEAAAAKILDDLTSMYALKWEFVRKRFSRGSVLFQTGPGYFKGDLDKLICEPKRS